MRNEENIENYGEILQSQRSHENSLIKIAFEGNQLTSYFINYFGRAESDTGGDIGRNYKCALPGGVDRAPSPFPAHFPFDENEQKQKANL